jgi:hypothetical protein
MMADHDHEASEPTGDWRAARHARRLRQRRLPRGLREDVERVRRDDLADGIMDVIFNEVRAQAGATDLVTIGDAQVVMPVVERRVLREMNCNAAFRGRVRREIAGLLRSVHLTCVDPAGATSVPRTLGPAPSPHEGVLRVRSSIGLGTATFLEAEPEGWAHYAVTRMLEKHLHDDMEPAFEPSRLRVYSVGAGAGSVARVVTALDAPAVVEVEEVDPVLGEATTLPCVVGTRSARAFDEKFDAVVMVLPAPAEGGAANHRRIYGHGAGLDLATLSKKRWLDAARGWFEGVAELLTPLGEVFALVPASVRWVGGYANAPELLNEVVARAGSAGLRLDEKLRVVEIEPVAQPFIDRERPEMWSLRLSLPSRDEANV